MKKFFSRTYWYIVSIPDRLYPFKTEVEGEWVRGERSYEAAVDRALKQYGLGRIGYKLAFYREIFHFVGSILFIAGATLLSNHFFGGQVALYALFMAAVLALSYQEFYLHPKRFSQHFGKGLADWLVWVVPMVLYLLIKA